MTKKFKGLLGALALTALIIGCNSETDYSLMEIKLATPKVTGTSKFGANLIEWEDVNHARLYRIYRKGGDDSEEKLLATVQPGKEYYADFIDVENILSEEVTYTYRVEAARSEYSRAATTVQYYDTDDSYKNSSASVDITVTAGNAPAYDSKAPTPTSASLNSYIAKTNKDSKISIKQDSLADGKTMETYGYAHLTGGYGFWDTVQNKWYNFQFGGDTAFSIPYPGTYKIYAYNIVKGGNAFYAPSKYVHLDTIKIGSTNDVKYFTNSYVSANDDGTISVIYAISKDCVTEGVTYKIVRGVLESYNRYDNTVSDGNIRAITDLTTLDIAFTSYEDIDGVKIYKSTDKDVKEGVQYIYFFQGLVDGELKVANISSATSRIDLNSYNYFTNNGRFNATSGAGKIGLMWTFKEEAVTDGVTYKIYKAAYDKDLDDYINPKEITPVTQKTVNEDYTVEYVAIDEDVEHGKSYKYWIKLYVGEKEIQREDTSIDKFNNIIVNRDIDMTETDEFVPKITKDTTTGKYTNDLYVSYHFLSDYAIPSGAKVSVTRTKYLSSEGWGTPVELTADSVEFQNDEDLSFYFVNFVDKNLEALPADDSASKYKYSFTFETNEGVYIYNWTYSSRSWNDQYGMSKGLNAYYGLYNTATSETYTIPIILESYATEGAEAIDVSKVTVKFLLGTWDEDYNMAIYSIQSFTGFTNNKKKECSLNDLPEGKDIWICMAIVDSNDKVLFVDQFYEILPTQDETNPWQYEAKTGDEKDGFYTYLIYASTLP